jgi:hypothetical protein
VVQQSKILYSRNEWREKAVKRAVDIREYRKAERRHLETIREQKQAIKELEQKLQEKKEPILVAPKPMLSNCSSLVKHGPFASC